MKRFRKYLVISAVMITALISLNFKDSYFEISKNLDIFASLYRELNVYYVDDTQPGELMKTGIDAMLKSLDPYTNYIPESQIEDYKFMTTGQYGGIGALIIKKDDYIILTEVYEDFPAHKSGLLPGDKLIEIDGHSVVGKKTEDISDFLKGEPKSIVKIVVERGEGNEKQKIVKDLEREEIKIKDVPYYGMLDKHTGYIVLSSFTHTASDEFLKAYRELKKNQDFNQLVFDLRGNGGGLLKESVNIVNMFVEKGTKIVDTKGRIKEWNHSYHALNSPVDLDIPIVVLINGSSASASEIVAGALQDLDRAVIIGQSSYGKGLVQQTKPLSYNAQLKVTVAKYYIPSGRCIQKLDYSHRNEDGSVSNVPDSLIGTFKSLKNGRLLHDGKGINPDIPVTARDLSAVSQVLVIKLLVFDYATKYHKAHASIAAPEEFKLSDQEYQEFIDYLSDKDYEYETETESLLEELKETAKEERYFEQAEEEFEILKAKMVVDKKDDLTKFQEEIRELLEYEIIARYYFDRGRIEASLKNDPVVIEALNVLNSKEKYDSILAGQYEPVEKN